MTHAPHAVSIVVAIDFSDTAGLALEKAAQLAAASRGTLHPVYVLDDAPDSITGRVDIELLDRRFRTAADRAKAFLDERTSMLAEHLGPLLHETVRFHVRAGAPADAVIALAAELDADLIVVGTHGLRGIARFTMGSVSEKIVRLAHCPVLVVRAKDHPVVATNAVEPACPDCVKTRATTTTGEQWCERHSHGHAQAHRFSYVPSSSVHGPMSFGD